MLELSLLFGALVGLSLGLTGGGGSIFAVPLLVYGLSVSPREAISVSLAAVGATACVGFLARLRHGEVELRTGLLFATSGVLGAPVGAFIGRFLADSLLLVLFAVLMLVVALRMWLKATRDPEQAREVRASFKEGPLGEGPSCRRDDSGSLRVTSRCAIVLLLVGVVAGILSGLFGVGGGFVIVPSLVLVTQMQIRRAVATSLLVIALVSASGIISYGVSDGAFNASLTLLFSGGGVVGLLLGGALANRLSGPILHKVFAVSMVLVAAFTITKTLMS